MTSKSAHEALIETGVKDLITLVDNAVDHLPEGDNTEYLEFMAKNVADEFKLLLDAPLFESGNKNDHIDRLIGSVQRLVDNHPYLGHLFTE